MESKHTPGPWDLNGLTITADAGNPAQPIAMVHQFLPEFRAESEANARLIAAAPDMLAALEWFVEFCDEHPEWTENELCNGRDDSAEALWLASARAAIARAEGGK